MSLPQRVEELRRLIGSSAALKLVERFGGTRVYVPARAALSQELVKTIGLQAAKALAREYGGDAFELPRCAARLRAVRNAEIRAQYDAGKSAAALARDFILTERHVWRILAEPDEVEGAAQPRRGSPAQGELF